VSREPEGGVRPHRPGEQDIGPATAAPRRAGSMENEAVRNPRRVVGIVPGSVAPYTAAGQGG